MSVPAKRGGDLIVHRIAAKVTKDLEHNDHYANEVKVVFDPLLFQVLTFCADRLDASAAEIGERGDYRFRSDARVPTCGLHHRITESYRVQFAIGTQYQTTLLSSLGTSWHTEHALGRFVVRSTRSGR